MLYLDKIKTMAHKRLNLNTTNSKVINEQIYITAIKALMATPADVNYDNKITHPTLGQMYLYEGTYARK